MLFRYEIGAEFGFLKVGEILSKLDVHTQNSVYPVLRYIVIAVIINR